MTRKTKPIAVGDFETLPFKFGRIPVEFAVEYHDDKTTEVFWGDDCAAQFAHFVENRDVICYFHNGGKFDFFFLLEYLDHDKIKIINGRIAECRIGKCILRDSFLILPLALKNHNKTEIDYAIFEDELRDIPANKKLILEYLHNDCISLFEWITKFRERFGHGLTLAGRAFNELKKLGYDLPSATAEYDSEIRPFYFGGRVQCFEHGHIQGPLTYIDLNSAYPHAMMHEHPFAALPLIKQKTLPDHRVMQCYFATILAVSRGALPYREIDGPDKNKLLFPDDDIPRLYNVTGWEICAGLETGTLEIEKVVSVLIPTNTAHFRPYVEKFYTEKAECKSRGDRDGETFAKLMLNSCYGKFGTDAGKFKDFCLSDLGVHPGEPWELHENLHQYDLQLFSKPAPLQRFFNVATAASITGFVRAHLWRTICASDRPIYCDTDSLICHSSNAIIGPELGQWKIEAVIDDAYIGGRKMYALRTGDTWKTATKGFRFPAEKLAENIKNGTKFDTKQDAPSFSVTRGVRFTERKISPKNC